MAEDPDDIKYLRTVGTVADESGIREVARIMKKYLKDPWVQCECTLIVWNFIFHFPKYKKVFYEHDGVPTLMESINYHLENELYGRHICRNGLFIIHHMATVILTKEKKIKTTLVHQMHDQVMKSGSHTCAIKAMEFYESDARLQEAGAAALGWYAYKATQKDRALCIIAGGLAVCEKAQASFQRNQHLQRYCNWTIELLRTADAEYKAELIAIEEAKRRREMIDKMVQAQIQRAREKDRKLRNTHIPVVDYYAK